MRIGDEMHESYSAPQIAPLYEEGPYHYHGATVLAIFYSIEPSLVRDLLPEPLESAGSPHLSLWFFEYPQTNGLGSYNEMVVGVNAHHDGDYLMYVLYEGLDSEVPICAGREIHSGNSAEAHGFTVVADSASRTAEEELRLRCCSRSTLPSEESGC